MFSLGYDKLKYAYYTIIFWAAFNVMAKVSVEFDASPPIYICVVFITASFVLFKWAGPGRLGYKMLMNPYTMGYAVLSLLENIFTVYLFVYIASTEGSMLQRVNVILVLLFALTVSGKKPSLSTGVGSAVLLGGLYLVFTHIEPSVRGDALFWLILAAACQVGKTLISEFHPVSNEARRSKDHARITAFACFVTSLGLLILLLTGSFAKHFLSNGSTIFAQFPDLSAFVHPETFIIGFLLGITIEAPAIYCYWMATKKVKTSRFIAISALVPLLTFCFEYPLYKLGIVDMRVFSSSDLGALALIYIGVLFIQIEPRRKMFVTKHDRDLKLTKERIYEAIAHCGGSKDDAAEALCVKASTIDNILSDEKAYKSSTFEKIKKNFAENIEGRDPVTRLPNRRLFISSMHQAIDKDKLFTLMFIDLNKFKPINDKYGHDVGDEILKEIARRFEAKYSHVANITRLGGDEFCLMFYGMRQEAAEAEVFEVKRLVSSPVEISGIDEVLEVGSSIGMSHFPEDGDDAEAIMKIADERMYLDKKKNGVGR